jgi:hypothetical protein
MQISFNESEDYCIFIGELQSGKTFVFESMEADSIHMAKQLKPNIINMFSITTIYEKFNIIGLQKYLQALNSKLNGCYILQHDFKRSILKHTNDIILNYGNPKATDFQYVEYAAKIILHSHYFTLSFFQNNDIQYNMKNILALPPGNTDIEKFFEHEIKKYNLKIREKQYPKMDYEWSYEKLKDEIQKNLLDKYNIKHNFKLNEYLNYIEEWEYNAKKLYRIL